MSESKNGIESPKNPSRALGHQRYLVERLAGKIAASRNESSGDVAIQTTHIAPPSPDKVGLRVTNVPHKEYGDHMYLALGTEDSDDHLVRIKPPIGHTGPTSQLMPDLSEDDARQMIDTLRHSNDL